MKLHPVLLLTDLFRKCSFFREPERTLNAPIFTKLKGRIRLTAAACNHPSILIRKQRRYSFKTPESRREAPRFAMGGVLF